MRSLEAAVARPHDGRQARARGFRIAAMLLLGLLQGGCGFAAGGEERAAAAIDSPAYPPRLSSCLDFSKGELLGPSLASAPRFGCANFKNLLTASASPDELLRPAGAAPADGPAAAAAVERYRRDEVKPFLPRRNENGF